MKPFLIVCSLLVFLASLSVAQDAPVEVESIRFQNLQDDWVQMEVTLRAGRNMLPNAKNERFVDDIKVSAYLAYEIDPKARKFDFYRAEVEIISMEQGDSQNVYFFMPGVIVERDRLPKQPEYYFVSLEVAGQTMPMTTSAYTSRLTATSIQSFKERADAEAGKNEFILKPDYNAPVGLIRADMRDMATLRIREPR